MSQFGLVRTLASIALGMAAALTALAPAHAHSVSIDNEIASVSRLVVAVDGHITGQCELGSGASIDFGVLSGNETAVADVPFRCNTPFEIGLQSVNGGLTHAALPSGQGPFAGTLGYSVDVRIPTRDPQPGILTATFDGRDLVGRKTVSSEGAIAAGGARLRFRTDRPIGQGLLAGEYSDTLYLTVSQRL